MTNILYNELNSREEESNYKYQQEQSGVNLYYRWTFLENTWDNQGAEKTKSWESIANTLTQLKEGNSNKLLNKAFIPGRFEGSRKNKNITEISGLVIDHDGKDHGQSLEPSTIEQMLGGIEAVAHTTFSSKPSNHRWRIVVPLKEPIPPSQLEVVHLGLSKLTGLTNYEAQHPSKLYLLPTANQDNLHHWSQGEILDPGKLREIANESNKVRAREGNDKLDHHRLTQTYTCKSVVPATSPQLLGPFLDSYSLDQLRTLPYLAPMYSYALSQDCQGLADGKVVTGLYRPYEGEENPSCQVMPRDEYSLKHWKEEAVFQDFKPNSKNQLPCYSVAEVYISRLRKQCYRGFLKRNEEVLWLIRLAWYAGLIDLIEVSISHLNPADVPNWKYTRWLDGLELLFKIKASVSGWNLETAYGRYFASRWCGISFNSVRMAAHYYETWGLIKSRREDENKRACKLYEPAGQSSEGAEIWRRQELVPNGKDTTPICR